MGARQEHVKENAKLIRFIQQNHISLGLGSRIQTRLHSQATETRQVHRIHMSDVSLLQQLPANLKEQVACEVFSPMICAHPLVQHIDAVDRTCVSAICQTSMSQQSVLPMHDVYALGSQCQAMYFVVAGEMSYIHGYMTKPESLSDNSCMIAAGNWACELALLIIWKHHGLMTVMEMPCELALIEAAAFHRVLRQWPQVQDICRKYALIVVEEYSRIRDELSDLPIAHQKAEQFAEQAMASW